jgi:microcystin-dependent protein
MAKTKISEFDSTPANNTDIDSINIAEGCAPSGINNAIRELMSQLKDQQTGAAGDNFTVGGNLAVTGTSAFTGATTFTGIPSGPTASAGTNTTQLATTAFVLANGPASPIPAGSVILFYQSAAPTGWTQVTTQNDKVLRVVSGTGGGASGTTAFSSVFTNQTPTITTSGLSAGATTLSTAQMPSHSHTYNAGNNPDNTGSLPRYELGQTNTLSTNAEGGGGSHTHSISGSATSSAITLNVQYIDIILCSKN